MTNDIWGGSSTSMSRNQAEASLDSCGMQCLLFAKSLTGTLPMLTTTRSSPLSHDSRSLSFLTEHKQTLACCPARLKRTSSPPLGSWSHAPALGARPVEGQGVAISGLLSNKKES